MLQDFLASMSKAGLVANSVLEGGAMAKIWKLRESISVALSTKGEPICASASPKFSSSSQQQMHRVGKRALAQQMHRVGNQALATGELRTK